MEKNLKFHFIFDNNVRDFRVSKEQNEYDFGLIPITDLKIHQNQWYHGHLGLIYLQHMS